MGRGNVENLKPNTERTPEERKELAAKAGRASGEARRAYKSMRDIAMELGEEVVASDKAGNKYSRLQSIVRKQYQRADEGDTAAFLAIMKARGEERLQIEQENTLIVHLADDGLGGTIQ